MTLNLKNFLKHLIIILILRFKKYALRDKLIFTMFAYTGLRRTELINLNWNDINLGNKYLIVRKSKNKNQRIIPLHDKANIRTFLLLSLFILFLCNTNPRLL